MEHSKSRKHWSVEDELFVIHNYKKASPKELEEVLGREYKSISAKYHRLLKQGMYVEEFKKRRFEGTESEQEKRISKLKKIEKQESDKAYKEILARDRNMNYGLKNRTLEMKFKHGQVYIVKDHVGRDKRIFKGVLIQETDSLVVLKGRWIESFLKIDFLIGEYEIKEVNN